MMTLKNYERASAKYFDKEIFNNQTINLHQVLHQFNYLLEYFNINLPCYTNSAIFDFDFTTLINTGKCYQINLNIKNFKTLKRK